MAQASPIKIKNNYDFIPARLNGGSLKEFEETEGLLKKLEDDFFSKWRKQYNLIILDFGAGGGTLNTLFSKICDKVCIVMTSDDISHQAVRNQLRFLFAQCDLDNITCCINMWMQKRNSINRGSLFNDFPGIQQSEEYAALYKSGHMIEISSNDLCEQLFRIVSNVYEDSSEVIERYCTEVGKSKKKIEESQSGVVDKKYFSLLSSIILFCSMLLASFVFFIGQKDVLNNVIYISLIAASSAAELLLLRAINKKVNE